MDAAGEPIFHRAPVARQPGGAPSAGVGQEDGDLLCQGAKLLGVGPHAVDVLLVLSAPFPRGGLALESREVVAGESDLLARDAGVGAAAVVLRAADDAVVLGATAHRAIVVERRGFGRIGNAEALGHDGRGA
jgi:hypothetical protein